MKKLNDVIKDKIWVLSSQKEFDGDERITTIINIRLVDPLWVQITTQITDHGESCR